MNMPTSINKLERAPKGLAKAHRIVPYYWKAAASFWPIKREGRNDGVSSDLQGPLKARDIRRTVMVLGEEVESRPIVPDIVSLRWLPNGGVRYNPMNLSSIASKARFSGLKCRPR